MERTEEMSKTPVEATEIADAGLDTPGSGYAARFQSI